MMGKKFELYFESKLFNKHDILESIDCRKFKVLSTPKPHYKKWYFRVLNYLTFKQLFNFKYTYTVKEI